MPAPSLAPFLAPVPIVRRGPAGAARWPCPASGLVAVALGVLALGAAPALGAVETTPTQDPACTPAERMPLEGRASPYDSVSVRLGDAEVKLCYGRPSARNRTMIGGDAVPFGQFWRAGANEPTTLHTTGAIEIAGVELAPGSYSFYARPGEERWEVFLSRAIDRWGIPINDAVRAEEVGSAEVAVESPEQHVETLTFRFDRTGAADAELVMEWERTRITLPLRAP